MLPSQLIINFDGACEPNPQGWAVYGWIITDADGEEIAQGYGVAAKPGSKLATNNFAEYCGLGFALRWLASAGWKGELSIRGDSMLVINQLTEE